MAGLTDGLYQEVEGLVLLPKLLLDLYKAKYDVFYAYTASYLQCPETLGKLDEERAKELYRRMDRQRPNTIFGKVLGFFDSITDYVSDYQDQRCEDALKLREEVSELLEFLKERENLKQLISDVEEKLADYWDTISHIDNTARYHHGKILVFAATFVVPGLGQLTKIKKVKKILEWIRKATPNELLRLKLRYTDDLTSVVDDVLKKAGDAFLQAKNQSKVWSGYDCSEIAEDIFEAVGEGKIIRIEAKNGNWLKVKQEGVVEEFQYHEIYLYKDNVYDVRFDDGPVSYDNFMQHIYEANSIDITTTIIRQ